MAKSYATVADVEAVLGRTLTPTETARATELLEAATVAFDRETQQSFADGAPIVAELRAPTGLDVWLGRYPVASVQAVRARSLGVGEVATALVALEGYELVDPAAGRLRLGGSSEQVSVDYTPTNVPAPLDVAEAIAQWAAVGLSTQVGAAGIEQVSVGMGEVALRYRATDAAAGAVPPQVASVIERYRRAVWA